LILLITEVVKKLNLNLLVTWSYSMYILVSMERSFKIPFEWYKHFLSSL